MLKEILICDKCGAETDTPIRERANWRISLMNGERSPDPGGGISSDDTADLDLCSMCMASLCRLLLRAYVSKERHLEVLRIHYPLHVPKKAS